MATAEDSPRQFLTYYSLQVRLARGGFSVVCRCVNIKTNQEYAVKIINIENLVLRQIEKIEKEAIICRKLTHQNIVRLHDTFTNDNRFYLVFELMRGGDLLGSISKRKRYSELDASFAMKQLLQAVSYCHQHNIVHRDIKPDNILLANDDSRALLKLTDFGLAIEVKGDGKNTYGISGTPNYMAPEILKVEKYGKPIDIWSCGVVLFGLVSGQLAFWGKDPEDLCIRIKKGEYSFSHPVWNDASTEVKNLIDQMLHENQCKRATAEGALTHPWIIREGAGKRAHRQMIVENMRKLCNRSKLRTTATQVLVAQKATIILDKRPEAVRTRTYDVDEKVVRKGTYDVDEKVVRTGTYDVDQKVARTSTYGVKK